MTDQPVKLDWVARLSDPERRAYYNKIIAFECPVKPKGDNWRIRDCLDRCEFSCSEYRSHKGRTSAYFICGIDEGERDLETGKRTRNC